MAHTDTRSRLLDVAERLFAEHGYDGVSLRQITSGADAQLAMVNYHFGSKRGLWREVISRRIEVLSEERLKKLEQCEVDAAGGVLSVEALIEAFIGPFYRVSTTGEPGWIHYRRLVAQAANSAQGAAPEIVELFDPVAKRFMAAFHRALPDHTEEQVAWGFTFLLGTMLHMFAETGRIDNLTAGRYRSSDLDAIYAHVVPFLAAGFRACRFDPRVLENLGEGVELASKRKKAAG